MRKKKKKKTCYYVACDFYTAPYRYNTSRDPTCDVVVQGVPLHVQERPVPVVFRSFLRGFTRRRRLWRGGEKNRETVSFLHHATEWFCVRPVRHSVYDTSTHSRGVRTIRTEISYANDFAVTLCTQYYR